MLRGFPKHCLLLSVVSFRQLLTSKVVGYLNKLSIAALLGIPIMVVTIVVIDFTSNMTLSVFEAAWAGRLINEALFIYWTISNILTPLLGWVHGIPCPATVLLTAALFRMYDESTTVLPHPKKCTADSIVYKDIFQMPPKFSISVCRFPSTRKVTTFFAK